MSDMSARLLFLVLYAAVMFVIWRASVWFAYSLPMWIAAPLFVAIMLGCAGYLLAELRRNRRHRHTGHKVD